MIFASPAGDVLKIESSWVLLYAMPPIVSVVTFHWEGWFFQNPCVSGQAVGGGGGSGTLQVIRLNPSNCNSRFAKLLACPLEFITCISGPVAYSVPCAYSKVTIAWPESPVKSLEAYP